MAPTDPTSDPARTSAIAQLRHEHRQLARVIETLETLTAEIAEATAAPDFALLAAILYYVDTVPERWHHPKEDEYLFAALRVRDPGSAGLLEQLAKEHQRSPLLIGELARALVHWQGGARDGLAQFAAALGSFAEFHWAHMRLEETQVLPRAERSLRVGDWQRMAHAFAANDDPLFGQSRGREFERLYHRIANLAPRKLKLGLLKDAEDTP